MPITSVITTGGNVPVAGKVLTFTPVLDTSIYADNDVLFVPIEVTGFFLEAGGTRSLHSVVVLDGDDQNTDFDLYFFDATVTLGTLNSAVSISDADAAKCLGSVRMEAATDSDDLINSRLFVKRAVGLQLQAAAASTSLWVGGVVRSGTPTYTASGMKIKLGVLS